jgi:hypothetical protein
MKLEVTKCRRWDKCAIAGTHVICEQPIGAQVCICPYYKSLLSQKRIEEKEIK